MNKKRECLKKTQQYPHPSDLCDIKEDHAVLMCSYAVDVFKSLAKNFKGHDVLRMLVRLKANGFESRSSYYETKNGSLSPLLILAEANSPAEAQFIDMNIEGIFSLIDESYSTLTGKVRSKDLGVLVICFKEDISEEPTSLSVCFIENELALKIAYLFELGEIHEQTIYATRFES